MNPLLDDRRWNIRENRRLAKSASPRICELEECNNELPPERTRFCCDLHGDRDRKQRERARKRPREPREPQTLGEWCLTDDQKRLNKKRFAHKPRSGPIRRTRDAERVYDAVKAGAGRAIIPEFDPHREHRRTTRTMTEWIRDDGTHMFRTIVKHGEPQVTAGDLRDWEHDFDERMRLMQRRESASKRCRRTLPLATQSEVAGSLEDWKRIQFARLGLVAERRPAPKHPANVGRAVIIDDATVALERAA